jgi:alpha-glucuronidase
MDDSRTQRGGPDVVDRIKRKFAARNVCDVPLLKGSNFEASLTDTGIDVDNLGVQPHLPWRVFEEACVVLNQNGGSAKRGDAMMCRLGEEGLPLSSIEGHIAAVVYGKQRGESVFRRSTPVICILVWAGICHVDGGVVSFIG